MVLDREGIARTTVWPRALLAPDGTADYPRIVAKLASDPESVARELEARFERLAELPALVDDLGLPASAQRHPRINLTRFRDWSAQFADMVRGCPQGDAGGSQWPK